MISYLPPFATSRLVATHWVHLDKLEYKRNLMMKISDRPPVVRDYENKGKS